MKIFNGKKVASEILKELGAKIKKEKILARKSALAATANKQLVAKRGHKFKETMTLPIVVEDGFGNDILSEFPKKARELLEKMGIDLLLKSGHQ